MAGARWTEEEWQAYIAKNKQNLEENIKNLGLNKPKKKTKKRKGVEVKPIIDSLKNPTKRISYKNDTLSIWWGGARLLTVNELFAIFQYRKYETFAYKKQWKELIKSTVSMLDKKPFFDKNVEMILYRSGKKLIDLDSFSTIFKYAIDGLKDEGIISDDNPNVISSIMPWQITGEPEVGIQLKPGKEIYLPKENVLDVWDLRQKY
jgi:hypothetical protein